MQTEEVLGQRSKRRRPGNDDEASGQASRPRPDVSRRPSEITQSFDGDAAAAALQTLIHKGTPLSVLGLLQAEDAAVAGQRYFCPMDGVPVAVGGAGQPPESFFDLPSADQLASFRYGEAALMLLRTWFGRHWSSPYLDPESKAWLADQTGMSPEAVAAWVRSERKAWAGTTAAATAPSGLTVGVAMEAQRDEDGVEDEEDMRVLLRRGRRKADGHNAGPAAALDPVGAQPVSLGTAVLKGQGMASTNGCAVPNVASAGLLFDQATAGAVSVHAGVAPVVAGGPLPLAPGVHVSVPGELAKQGVAALVLGPEGTLFAFDAAGTPLGTVPYGLTPAQAGAAAAAISHAAALAAAGAAASASMRMAAYGLPSGPLAHQGLSTAGLQGPGGSGQARPGQPQTYWPAHGQVYAHNPR